MVCVDGIVPVASLVLQELDEELWRFSATDFLKTVQGPELAAAIVLQRPEWAALPIEVATSTALASLLAAPGWAAPGYAVWGTFKYQPGFDHFDYVNPQAPRGGELRLIAGSRISTFDKYNPFTLKGTAPSFLADLLFESLLTAPMDEIGVGYGLLAGGSSVGSLALGGGLGLRRAGRGLGGLGPAIGGGRRTRTRG